MAISDIIAISVLLILVLIGAWGKLRWASGAVTGALFACLILATVGLMLQLPWFSRATGGHLDGGVVLPSVTQQVVNVGENVGIRIPYEPPQETDAQTRTPIQDANGSHVTIRK